MPPLLPLTRPPIYATLRFRLLIDKRCAASLIRQAALLADADYHAADADDADCRCRFRRQRRC